MLNDFTYQILMNEFSKKMLMVFTTVKKQQEGEGFTMSIRVAHDARSVQMCSNSQAVASSSTALSAMVDCCF